MCQLEQQTQQTGIYSNSELDNSPQDYQPQQPTKSHTSSSSTSPLKEQNGTDHQYQFQATPGTTSQRSNLWCLTLNQETLGRKVTNINRCLQTITQLYPHIDNYWKGNGFAKFWENYNNQEIVVLDDPAPPSTYDNSEAMAFEQHHAQ